MEAQSKKSGQALKRCIVGFVCIEGKDLKNKLTVVFSIITVLALTAVYLLHNPALISGDEGAGLMYRPHNLVRDMAAFCKEGELMVYPAGYQSSVEIGGQVEFIVERDGEILSWHDVSYEIVRGRDCAFMFIDGYLCGMGEGFVAVKAFLDADPEVCSYGSVQVVPSVWMNRYNEFRDDDLSIGIQGMEFEDSISGFPESYKPYLRRLHTKYPNWQFRPFFTGQNFYDAVDAQSLGNKNVTLLANFADLLKSKAPGDYVRDERRYILKDTGWVSVNSFVIARYMDPRNFLDERYIFQFELLTFDEGVHALEGVEGILKGSFMYKSDTSYIDAQGNKIPSDKTYAETILEAGRAANVNPYFIAAKIKNEIGNSPSKSATGTCPGYEGYYNFYNIGATDGEGNIERGLSWASGGPSYNRPWTSPEKSIIGGAQFLAGDYISVGQYTGYLQKFNVNPDADYPLHTHQYQTNVSAAASQGYEAYSGYKEIGILQYDIVFSIPVFEGMGGPATEISLGGPTPGIAAADVQLRSGPSAFHNIVGGVTLKTGEGVTVRRCVRTDSSYFRNWMMYPVWYEVECVRDGESYVGFVSEEFLARGASTVLKPGQSCQLDCRITAGVRDTVRYFSENTDVATVSDNGKVVAVSNGVVKIFAYTSCGAMDSVTILVY